MSSEKKRLKAELLEKYGQRLDKLFEELDPDEEIHLTEIEEAALAIRQELSRDLTQSLANRQSKVSSPEEVCPKCGGMMHNKGRKKKHVRSRSGDIDLERPYYYCAKCQSGHFPPG